MSNSSENDLSIGNDGLQKTPAHSSSDSSSSNSIDDFVEPSEGKEGGQPLNRVRRFSTVMNLLNTLLGAGILTVPSSFTNAGMIVSIVLLFFIAILSYIATVQVIKLQLDSG